MGGVQRGEGAAGGNGARLKCAEREAEHQPAWGDLREAAVGPEAVEAGRAVNYI